MDEGFTSELEMLEKAISSGDATAYLGLADLLSEQEHPHGEILCALAKIIMTSESSGIQLMATQFFDQVRDMKDTDKKGVLYILQLMAQIMDEEKPKENYHYWQGENKPIEE